MHDNIIEFKPDIVFTEKDVSGTLVLLFLFFGNLSLV